MTRLAAPALITVLSSPQSPPPWSPLLWSALHSAVALGPPPLACDSGAWAASGTVVGVELG